MEKIGACKLPRRAARRIVEEPWGVSRQPVAQQLETLLLKIRDEQKRVCADNCAGLENLGVALGELTANAVAAVQAVRESLRKRTSEHRGSRIATRGDLSAELLRRIASFVPPNEVVCSLRRVDKFTLAQLSNWKPVVRLSQAVPHGAFIERWGSPEAMWDMTLQQRRQLLALTAASGSLANLQVAFEAAGCTLVRDMEDLLLEAAATGGSHGVCQWLLDKGCSPRTKAVELAAKAGHLDLVRFLLRHDPSPSRFGYGLVADAFAAAAGAGQRAVCEGLLAHVAEQWVAFSTWSAARGGHVDLAQWLLQQLPREGVMVANYQNRLLADAAFGFDLPSLQRLCLSLRNDGHLVSISRAVAAAAIAGPSPDWRAKYEWLRGEGIEVADDSIHLDGWDSFLGREDCTERLELLQQLGKMDHDEGVIDFAVRTANLPLLQYATVQGVWGRLSARHAEQAAGSGNVAFLAGLLAMGCPIGPGAAEAAARRGHLRVLQWLAGPEAGRAGAAVLADACLVECAPESGSVELMQLLRERGCPWDERVFVIAAASGNTAFVEWLASAGCPKDGRAYVSAAQAGDQVMLHRLRQLGCPWDSSTFSQAVFNRGLLRPGLPGSGCSLATLRWLLAQGCPVDWPDAKERAAQRERERSIRETGMLKWVERQWRKAVSAAATAREGKGQREAPGKGGVEREGEGQKKRTREPAASQGEQMRQRAGARERGQGGEEGAGEGGGLRRVRSRVQG